MKSKPATRPLLDQVAEVTGRPTTTLDDLFPSRDPSLVPTSLRFSKVLLDRIDQLSAAKGVTRTATIERLLTWALNELSTTGQEPSQEELAARRRRRGEHRFDLKVRKK